jgi:hypothetical protein
VPNDDPGFANLIGSLPRSHPHPSEVDESVFTLFFSLLVFELTLVGLICCRPTSDGHTECPRTGKPIYKQCDELMLLLAAEIGAERLIQIVGMLQVCARGVRVRESPRGEGERAKREGSER